MRLSPQTLTAAGDTPWVAVNPYLATPAGVGLAVIPSADANLTCAVQYTYDDLAQTPLAVTLSRVTTTLTVGLPLHGLSIGDSVQILNPSADPNNTFTSWYDVLGVTDENHFTVTVANAGAAAATGYARVLRVFTHPTLQGITGSPPARTDGGFSFLVGAFRLQVTVYAAGFVTLFGTQGLGR